MSRCIVKIINKKIKTISETDFICVSAEPCSLMPFACAGPGLSSSMVGIGSIREGKEETREGIDPAARPATAAEEDDEAGAGRGGLLQASAGQELSAPARSYLALGAGPGSAGSGGLRARWVASSGCRALTA